MEQERYSVMSAPSQGEGHKFDSDGLENRLVLHIDYKIREFVLEVESNV